jgi:hypothetical protein
LVLAINAADFLTPLLQVIARDCVQDAGEKFKESAMFYATARQRNAEKEMSEATLRKMHRKVRCSPSFEFLVDLSLAYFLRHFLYHRLKFSKAK